MKIVAWEYEWASRLDVISGERVYSGWRRYVGFTQPNEGYGMRNVRPLVYGEVVRADDGHTCGDPCGYDDTCAACCGINGPST